MGLSKRGIKFGTLVIFLETVFIVVIGIWGKYKPPADNTQVYPNFQDVNVMIFIGFGFLMTFLKNYGFSAVGVNMLISAICIQWAMIVRGFLHTDIIGGESFQLGLPDMVLADFATASVLISFGAVLGKASPTQLVVMGILEVFFKLLNEYIGVDLLHTADIGESMYIHMFGAYFGLAVALVLYDPDVKESTKEGSVYHSDLFAMIGTVFLWCYWPSFNGGFAGDFSERAMLNTFLSLAAATAVTFAISAFLDEEGHFDMVHVQNATLAGGVAVGASANMPMEPFGAMLFGSVAGIISVLGYKYITPFMHKRLRIHDTCGVHNLHGMPGILAAIGAAILCCMSDDWDEKDRATVLYTWTMTKNETKDALIRYPGGDFSGRSAGEQGAYQMIAAAITLGIALVGGAITGLIMRLPIWDSPKEDSLFDDCDNWELPEEGVPGHVALPHNYKASDNGNLGIVDTDTRM